MNRFGVAIAGVVLAVASGAVLAQAQPRGDWSRDRSYGDAQDEVRETQGSEDEKQPAQQDGDRRNGGDRSDQRDGGRDSSGAGQQADRNGGNEDGRNRGDRGQQASRSDSNQAWRGGDRDGNRDGNRGDWNGSADARSGDRYGYNSGSRNDGYRNDGRRHDNDGGRHDRDGHRNGGGYGNRGHRDGRYAYYSHGRKYGYNRWRAPSHYVRPRGWYSYRWGVGHRLPPAWYGPTYYVDYGVYGLAPPPYGYRWVRVNDDVLLVAIATGIIADVLTNFYYY